MLILVRLELVVAKYEGYLTESARFANSINKTPIIININLANTLLHMILMKRKKEFCTINLLSCMYVHTHFSFYCTKCIDLFGLWVFASVVDKCFMG